MNIKILSTQKYDDHEEKIEEKYNGASLNNLDKNVILKYNKNEIIINDNTKTINIKNEYNTLIVELNKQNEFDYETPYGKIKMKTIGEKLVIEQNPFKLVVEYNISLNELINYKNIIEIIED